MNRIPAQKIEISHMPTLSGLAQNVLLVNPLPSEVGVIKNKTKQNQYHAAKWTS